MTKTAENIDLTNLTTEYLETILAERKKAEIEERKAKKERYESNRDKKVNEMVSQAQAWHDNLADFKKRCFEFFDEMREDAANYGDIRKNTKGGFQLRASDTGKRIALIRNVKHSYDERADMAIGLIKEFLEEKIKKRDKATYTLVARLLEKNKQGDLEPSRVAGLLKIRDNYTDEKWQKAMQLLEESYHQRDVSMNIEFSTQDEYGKDQPVVLTFSSIKVYPDKKENEEDAKG